MFSISFDGGNSTKIEVKPGENVLNVISKITDYSKFKKDFLVMHKSRIINHQTPLDKQGVTEGLIEVFPNVSTTSDVPRKSLTEQIEDLRSEATRLVDLKIEKTLMDRHVFALCNSYFKSNPDVSEGNYDYYDTQQMNYSFEKYDPSVFPTEKVEPGIPSKPLPMEWKSDDQLEFYAEPQEPMFSSISQAGKYYKSRLTDQGWDW